jgi:predicted Rossmann-fold nucleotide-binding protein
MNKTDARNAVPAYHNKVFLDSDDGRSIRILCEYIEPYYRLQKEGVHDTIVFFGSSRILENGPFGNFYKDAQSLAKLITEWSLKSFKTKRFVICSGGGGGIMEAANRGALEAGGSTIGFNIGLPNEQRPNSYVSPKLLFEFHYFFMRKLWFSHLSRALIVFLEVLVLWMNLWKLLHLPKLKKLIVK